MREVGALVGPRPAAVLAHRLQVLSASPSSTRAGGSGCCAGCRPCRCATTMDVDVEGVGDIDEWIARLEAAGHHILATSGSSGKVSFLNHAPEDWDRKLRHWRNTLGWPYLRASRDRPFFSLGPSSGPEQRHRGGADRRRAVGAAGRRAFPHRRAAAASRRSPRAPRCASGWRRVRRTPGEIAASETPVAGDGGADGRTGARLRRPRPGAARRAHGADRPLVAAPDHHRARARARHRRRGIPPARASSPPAAA